MSDNSANIISLVTLAGETALRAYNGYQEARALALAAGITEEQLAESDARFAKTYIGPPPTDTAAVPPKPAGADYFKAYDFPVPPDADLRALGFVDGNEVQVNTGETKFRVINQSIGGAGWRTVRAIGEE